MKKWILLAALLSLSACDSPKSDYQNMILQSNHKSKSMKAIDEDRFDVKRVQVFQDDLAYEHKRGVYVITDKATGKEFIGISGIGISEAGSHHVSKITHQDER